MAQIEYWLDAGSLLGCYRGATVISHDIDVDIGMTTQQFVKLKTWLNQNPLPANSRFVFKSLEHHRDPLAAKFVDTQTGLGCDIFTFHRENGSLIAHPWIWPAVGVKDRLFVVPDTQVFPLKEARNFMQRQLEEFAKTDPRPGNSRIYPTEVSILSGNYWHNWNVSQVSLQKVIEK
jgi:hypothetical protein